MDNGNDQQMDVRSVVEAVSADHSFGAPLYVVESLCMRCGENVSLPLTHTYLHSFFDILDADYVVLILCQRRNLINLFSPSLISVYETS